MESTALLRPPAGRRPASGWLALALSVAVHAGGLLALWLLPCDPRPAERPPALINTCVLISDDESSAAAPEASEAKAPEPAPEGQREVGFSPTVLPSEPVPVEAGGVPAVQVPGAAEEMASGSPGDGGPGGRANAGRRGTTFFQVDTDATAVVYVIDRSASMWCNGGLDAARSELLASLARLPKSARFQVIAYNSTASPLCLGGRSDLVPADADNLREATALLARLRPSGKTKHFAALRLALELEPDVIFLVTDADDLTPEEVRLVTRLNRDRSAIHAIELGGRDDSRPGGPLETLARSNRGTYRFVPLAGAE
jgi:hypothetical protein